MKAKMKFFVPKDLIFADFKKFENISLILTKFCPFLVRDGKLEKPRYDWLGYHIKLSERSLKLYNEYLRRIEDLLSSIDAQIFKLRTKSRLVIGLGDESVYETSIRLNRNYGVPYIPGSALKGVTKHYVFSVLAEEYGDAVLRRFRDVKEDVKRRIAKREKISEKDVREDYYLAVAVIQELFERKFDKLAEISDLRVKVGKEDMNVEDFVKIFGTQSFEGLVIFFDAFPTPDQLKDKPILELDIMNPHYQPYYSAKENELKSVEKAPGDWHDPNPILFLTVPAGIEFQFALALRDGEQDLLNKAKNLLIKALENHGVGAKTSLGYGRFQ